MTEQTNKASGEGAVGRGEDVRRLRPRPGELHRRHAVRPGLDPPGAVATGPQPGHRRRPWRPPGTPEQLTFHLGLARENGVTQAELTEAITHLAFYAGWPRAMSAMAVAKQVLGDREDDQ